MNQKTILAGAFAFGLLVFAAMNAVWTSVDGKPRFGSSLFLESGIAKAFASLPNPFAKDPSEYLLPPLPEIEGWERTLIADPWTVRPINLDGTIPDDAQMKEILARRFPGETDPIPTHLNLQGVEDRRDRADGARRTAANYTDGVVRFNVVVEQLGTDEPIDPGGFGPLGHLLYRGGGLMNTAMEMVRRRRVIAGVPFVLTDGQEASTQQDTHEASLSLEAELDGYALRIWGDGTEEDVERLLLALRAVVKPHPMATGDLE